MSGGAFGYYEYHIEEIADRLSVYQDDPDICEKTKKYMLKLEEELRELYQKVKKMDYYLSGDSTEYI